MELSDEERYAVASLFTLALHATQYDGGNVTDEAWGCVRAPPLLCRRLLRRHAAIAPTCLCLSATATQFISSPSNPLLLRQRAGDGGARPPADQLPDRSRAGGVVGV